MCVYYFFYRFDNVIKNSVFFSFVCFWYPSYGITGLQSPVKCFPLCRIGGHNPIAWELELDVCVCACVCVFAVWQCEHTK